MKEPPDPKKRIPILWKIVFAIAVCSLLGLFLNCLLAFPLGLELFSGPLYTLTLIYLAVETILFILFIGHISSKEKKKGKKRYTGMQELAAFGIAIGAIFFVFFGPTAIRQSINLRKANAHNIKLNNAFQKYPECRQVKAVSYTGDGGCITIQGLVKDRYSANCIRNIVIESKPPLKVIYNLREEKTNRIIPMYRK